jgi:hypothetical protein
MSYLELIPVAAAAVILAVRIGLLSGHTVRNARAAKLDLMEIPA